MNKRDRNIKLKYVLIMVSILCLVVVGVAFSKGPLQSISLNTPATFPVDI